MEAEVGKEEAEAEGERWNGRPRRGVAAPSSSPVASERGGRGVGWGEDRWTFSSSAWCSCSTASFLLLVVGAGGGGSGVEGKTLFPPLFRQRRTGGEEE